MKIAIIGLGFVGGAIKNAYDVSDIEIICRDPAKGFDTSLDDVMSSDGIFVSVPSPQKEDGSCDSTILESILEELRDYKGVIISKVTAPPNVYQRLFKLYPNLVHAPEFLVAATAKEDYLNGEFAVVGGNLEYCKQALDIIKLGQRNLKNYKFCSIEEASLVKYTINCFLSVKVIFMNQLKKIADKSNADYDVIKECVKLDNRFGHSHFDVPGPDGKFGYGGACFPKDTAALLFYSNLIEENFGLLEKTIDINKDIRND